MILREFIVQWNNKYPLDRVWREKFKVAFNSSKHRVMTPFDIVFALKEDSLFDEFYQEYEERKKKKEDFSKGVILKEKQYSKEERERLNKALDSLELDRFNDIVSFEGE